MKLRQKMIYNLGNNFFDHDKYWYVGTVQHEPITSDPPAPCEHMKFPECINRDI